MDFLALLDVCIANGLALVNFIGRGFALQREAPFVTQTQNQCGNHCGNPWRHLHAAGSPFEVSPITLSLFGKVVVLLHLHLLLLPHHNIQFQPHTLHR